MERSNQIRAALHQYVSIIEETADAQLKIAVDAYKEQIDRLLDQADKAYQSGHTTDAEILLISAERWLWRIAKSCALYAVPELSHTDPGRR